MLFDKRHPKSHMISSLQERAKELNCLYKTEELMNAPHASLDSVCMGIIEAIPPGWQYPDICVARITIDDNSWQSDDFEQTEWELSTDVRIQDKVIGRISVYYTKSMPTFDYGPFLKEEKKLIGTIAERLGHFIMYHEMKHMFSEWDHAKRDISRKRRGKWQVVLDLLKQTDRNLYYTISHKMLNYLCWSGISEAEELRHYTGTDRSSDDHELKADSNRPHQKEAITISNELTERVFKIAADHLSENEILNRVQKWIQEDKLSFLVQVVNRNLSLSTVADAIRRYHHIEDEGFELHSPSKRGVTVSLIRRFMSDQLPFINIAKNFVEVGDFFHLLQNVIFSAESHGKLGGKSAGLYLAAQILKKSSEYADILGTIKIPKTWYITSDMLLHFMHFNNFDEIVEQKYKDINQVRFEYPHIVQTFKNSHFPPEMVKGLSLALDDLGDKPLIVRSSSLLEDRTGAAFSGKYKSLFIANQGSKRDRLDALLDAIAEVYASTFSPDPIEYRTERGLIDFGEEMGIMLQEVVGTKVGHYYLPTFAGVAFSKNEFRWSARIKRGDGLLRLVPGLGTRAVDRLADDYPVLIAPGQPNLRVNATIDETVKYSPKWMDVINLETNQFETVEVDYLLREYGAEIPGINKIVSIYEDGTLRKPMGMNFDFEQEEPVVTFEGQITSGHFIKQMQTILKVLEDKLENPVDIEFASDGKDFYLLQCRPQSYSEESQPAPIPKDVGDEKVLFTANKYISNGIVTDITHMVYIDPEHYGELTDRADMLAIGKAVGKLNKLLPKRQFILIGPGRWGSRGDIRLGVSVTYSDINNSAALIEMARLKGNYVPDLSFGTHFFQDLVEAGIRYLPLYPDDEGIIFNERFFKRAPNILPDVLPSFAGLKDVIHLIDIPRAANGQVMKILMNAELDEAMGLLTRQTSREKKGGVDLETPRTRISKYWQWRMNIADLIAAKLEPERFGVKALYIFGSTKNATAGPGSDIDLIVHVNGNPEQRQMLDTWFEGWNHVISEMNYQRTGYRTDEILDIHYVTDEDIKNRTSYAVKIGAVTDAARPLKIGNSSESSK
ncbi:MAG: pyruvate, phosphate dikinase [candidate division Zixibacteria bacterium]|nr:pyruvate, phosphate dikinase [candidate division Zixibacteria bacterium]